MLRRLARHRWIAAVLIAGVSLLLSVGQSLITLPLPRFHDEFSYVLAGETFARGRLTNPAHPLWKFFETFGVISQPTYMSKYPPVQGMFLAVGRRLFNEPIVGVWISTALACAAAWWGLAGLVPRRWALIGALLAALHPALLRWNWSYWGGAGAMIGGCLVVGAIARWKKSEKLLAGTALGLGIAILMNSRPFEGAILTLACILGALRRSDRRESVVRTLLAATPIALAALLWTGYYNHRITGHATEFPYALYEKQYAATAPLFWLPAPATPPAYNHLQMRDFYLGWEMQLYKRHDSGSGMVRTLGEKGWNFLKAYFGSPVLVVPALMSLLVLGRDAKLRRMTLIALVALAAAMSGIGFFPHYTAPAAILLLYFVIQGLRHLRAKFPRFDPRNP